MAVVKASASCTRAWASVSGLSSTMAVSVSPPSFLIKALSFLIKAF